MTTTLKNNLTPLIFFSLFTAIALINTDFFYWGMDGFSLWLPIVAEYLADRYEFSPVIFAGQNLMGIYGEQPWWRILRWLGGNPQQLLNLTLVFISGSLYLLLGTIYRGLGGGDSWRDQLVLILYCLLSPIVINRLYAGHFNLLLGMFPVLVALALIYRRDVLFLILGTILLWSSFSIQGYQILAYHLFYLPLLLVWLWPGKTYGSRSYWISLISMTLVALVLSIPVFRQLLEHAGSEGNLRKGLQDIVYSYSQTSLSDLPALLFASYNPFYFPRNFYFFHEYNYPLGLTLVAVFFLKGQQRIIGISLLVTMLIGLLFAANIFPFNLLAELPVIKLFRVPQRAMMVPALMFPLLFLVRFRHDLPAKSIIVLLLLIMVGNWVDYIELVALASLPILFWFRKKEFVPEFTYALVVSSLFMGLPDKIAEISKTNSGFQAHVQYMKLIDAKLYLSHMEKVVHFEGPNPIEFIAAANFLGIRTVEGYGHPPKSHFKILSTVTGLSLNPMSNSLLLNRNLPNYKELLKAFNVTDVVMMDDKGNINHSLIE
jgi:hypothetical protein